MKYQFRTLEWSDLPRLEAWLQTPEVVAWWGDPAHELALLREDMDEPQMTQLIVTCDGVPFAYAQHYDVRAWPQEHLAHLPAGARAVDAFVGEPAMLGRGHGSKFLRLLAEQLVAAGAPLVAIDPDEDNVRARKAYANAGFLGEQVVETESGPVVLMIYGSVHEILSPRG